MHSGQFFEGMSNSSATGGVGGSMRGGVVGWVGQKGVECITEVRSMRHVLDRLYNG